jgi:hypothetical protein
MDGCVSQGPSKVLEYVEGAQVIHDPPGTRKNDREMFHHRSPRRRRQEEKYEGGDGNEDRVARGGGVQDHPIDAFSPKDAANGEIP